MQKSSSAEGKFHNNNEGGEQGGEENEKGVNDAYQGFTINTD